jgi:regulator of RNase E activity RraA
VTVRAEVLRVARSVRTSDLSDAFDSMGLQERYVMSPEMRPLFPGIRFAGLAHTAEYDVTDRPLEPMTYETFAERQYAEGPEGLWREAGPWGAPDEVLVIDAKGTAAGILGSSNTLHGRMKGTVGFRHRRDVQGLVRMHDPANPGVLHGSVSGASDGPDPRGRGRRADRVRRRQGRSG